MNEFRKKILSIGLKFIGVLLFVSIIWNIDKRELAEHFKSVDVTLFMISFFFQFLIYAPKTDRWNTLVHQAGLKTTWYESWKLYNIGAFLATITPGKLGELGRSAYLQKQGIPLSTGIAIGVIDRVADAITIGAIALISVTILFSWKWALLLGLLGLLGLCILFGLWKQTEHISWLQFAHTLSISSLTRITLVTLLGWVVYFTWAILIASSLGIHLPIHTLVSIFTLTGLIAQLPIAPSGFGTRDAALLTLLAPFGFDASHAITLAFLMFVSILGSAIPGGWYWLTVRSKAEE